MALLVAGGAGGCSSTTPSSAPDKFIGTWTFGAGSMLTGTIALTGQPLSTSIEGQTFTFAKGTASDLVFDFGSCTGVKLTVSGSQASADAGQSCQFTFPFGGSNVTADVAITSWTNDSTDGLHLTMSAAGTTALATGPVMLNGTATKGAPVDAASGS